MSLQVELQKTKYEELISLQVELQKTTIRGTHVTLRRTTEDNNTRNSCHFK